jgi:hypothetical protein
MHWLGMQVCREETLRICQDDCKAHPSTKIALNPATRATPLSGIRWGFETAFTDLSIHPKGVRSNAPGSLNIDSASAAPIKDGVFLRHDNGHDMDGRL